MKLDNTTQILFSPYDREVANPKRWNIHSKDEFIKFIERNNGASDCYTSVYPLDGTIDKITFDLDDEKRGVVGVAPEARRLYGWLLMKGYNVIPVLSGKKGIHLHLLLRPKKYDDAKGLLTKATYSILCDVFGYDEGKKIKSVFIDSSLIGDIGQLIRIPNTLRPPENLAWCTYLPADWVKMTTPELVSHMKSPMTYDYDLDGTFPTLDTFPEPPAEIIKWKIVEDTEPAHPIKDNKFLKGLLRPCLYRHMMSYHPGHAVRVASTVDLLQFFEPAKVLEMYRVLEWDEWDPDETMRQIYSCRHLKPYSCKRLRQLGIPRLCCVE